MKRILLLSFLLSLTFMASAQLSITEISYNPPESGTDSLEYIELYNETSSDIDITGYTIQDNNAHVIAGGVVPAEGYAILAINPAAILEILGVASIEIADIALSNGGETITLQDADGTEIDVVGYDDNAPWPEFEDGADGAGATIELCDVTSDNSDGSNWSVSTNDLGVMVNDIAFLGTPNAANSSSCEFVPDYIVEVSNNVFTPSDLVIQPGESVRWMNVQGFHNVNGSLETYPDNPEGFMNGGAASGNWIFDFTFTEVGLYNYQCDPHSGLGMVGTITVEGDPEPTIPTYDIGLINTTNSDGVPDSVGVTCIIEGIVHGANLRPSGLQFALVDVSGDAIGLFSGLDLGYSYAEGDLIKVTGEIGHFNGLAQTSATAVEFVSAGNSLIGPENVSSLGEDTESKLVMMQGLRIVNIDDWTTLDPGGFNVVDFTDGTNTFAIFIDGDTDLGAWDGPAADKDYAIVGIGGQFDNSAPHDEGYQLIPRSMADFMTDLSVNELEISVSLFPNPAVDFISIETDIIPDSYKIYSATGKVAARGLFNAQIDVSNLVQGSYILVLEKDDKTKAIQFVK